MIGLAALGKLIATHPLDAALVAGIVATGGLLAWHVVVKDPIAATSLRAAERARDAIQVEHQRQVAAANFERAEQSEKLRKLEQENGKTISGLQAKVATLELKNAKLALDLSESADGVRSAEARYIAELARRSAADPGSACRINAEGVSLFGELRAETDRLAEESAKAADACAGRLGLLQDYVRDVCLRRPE